jgi:hypothetical protein
MIGYTALEHADKLAAWTLRLRAAVEARRRASSAGDAAAVRRAEEDVNFWIGRLTGEVLASQDAPGFDAARRDAVIAILDARNVRFGSDHLLRALLTP